MDKIQDMLKDVRKLSQKMASGSIIKSIVQRYENEIADLNSQDQLFDAGVTSNGEIIASYAPYAPRTIAIKQAKGQPYNRVTLRDTGDFHRSFFLEFIPDGFRISAKDWKTQELVDGYGEDIFGLTDENIGIVSNDYIKDDLIEDIRKIVLG